jgi:hypothetical protein
MDQPERRGTNCMMGGNSSCGARWGYSINLQEVHSRLVPCQRCQEKSFGSVNPLAWNITMCTVCSQWEMIRNDNLLHWDAPKAFPKVDGIVNLGKLKPMKLEYSDLIDATQKAHEKILLGKWTKTEASEFLSYYCINAKTAAQIVKQAQSMRAWDVVSKKRHPMNLEYETMVAQREKFPQEFEPWKVPSFWKRGLSINTLIDAPMHLVFLGAVQGITGFIHSWLRKHGKYSNFMRLAEGRLTCFKKFKLPWLKMLPYKGERLGGWVSENFVSFTRVCRWFYLILDELNLDEDAYKDPETPQKTWKAVENKGWLKARGLPHDGKAAELKERVAQYMSDKDTIPMLLPPPEGTMEDLHALIESMFYMVKSIMSFRVSEDDVKIADFQIKLFLTRLVDCDKKINPDAKVPFWISSYTYPCLLNLPAHMKEFGPLKNLWEGGVRGEGFLPYVKREHGTIGLR